MDKKYLFINNPISGGSKSNFAEIFESQKDNFPNHTLINTTGVGCAQKLAIQHKNDFDIIVAVGGDGTINEIASALVNTETPMGIIPRGSGNGFANHLGISCKVNKALEQLLTGTTKLVDTVVLNQKTFVNVAGVGFDGHITNIFNKTKLRGLWSYGRIAFTEFFRYKEFDYTLVADNRTLNGKAFVIALANSSQYGNNFHIAPNAKSNDGLVNIMIFKKPSIAVVPYIIWKVFKGSKLSANYCTEIVAKNIILNHPSQAVHVDGEVVEVDGNEIKIEVLQNSLNVIY